MASEPITNFSGANGSIFTVDGYSAQAENANQPWSLTEPNANTLQFSVQSGDRWRVGSYSDSGCNRSEIQFSPLYAEGTQINMSETITIQPGPTNTASWLDLTQLHATTNVAPTYSPFVLGLDQSDHLCVILQSPNQSSNNLVYRSPDPVVRGQPMDLDFQLIMGPSGGGYVGVWLDGTQIVNYHGAVGATNSEYYWKLGVYRGEAAEAFTATFSNVDISTGSAPAPTTPTQPTTPTSPIPTTPTSPTPTAPTSPTTPTSSVTRPVLSVADPSLWVAGRGGTVDLGTRVTTTDTNDRVSMNITGLPKYETITSALDGQTFRGRDVTLTAAQVNSGLTLTSTYRGGGHPVADLTLTASARDPVTGAVATSAPQTISVTDPRPAATTTTSPSSTSTNGGLRGDRLAQQQPVEPVTSTAASTAQRPITVTDHAVATAASAGFLANQGFERLQQHVESFTSTLATGRQQAIATDSPAGATTASHASQSFALLSQYLAGNTGRVDSGQIVAAVSQTAGWAQEAILTRPH